MKVQGLFLSAVFVLKLLAFLVHNIENEPTRLVVESTHLNTQTEVWIHQLGDSPAPKPILYFTDGRKLVDQNYWDHLETLFLQGEIPSCYIVFVGSIDLTDQSDRRNEYFFCNPAYLDFFEQELIPKVEASISQVFQANDRALVGVSFGGLNAAWFSAKSNAFDNFALLSPITYPCPDLLQSIIFSKNEGLSIYLSSGKNDAEQYMDPLSKIYEVKGYRQTTIYHEGRHDFGSWKAQLAPAIQFLFP
ncbi:MAG: YqiA/YcfP family alpha/beta fold hydrolase [Bacteroidota bacterium]